MTSIAIIDIGTNSMRMMISEVRDHKVLRKRKYINTTRMGQGINEKGYIIPEAMKRNFKTLEEFIKKAKNQGSEKIIVFATSALRDAKNKDTFIKMVKDKLNQDIQVLSGKQEAEIGFIGVSGEASGKDLLIVDIGGGSTELILGTKREGIEDLISLDIGALRATEKYIHRDPIDRIEMETLKKEIGEIIYTEIKKMDITVKRELVGIGGTITTLSAINQNMEEYDWKKVHKSKISLKDINTILERFILLPLEERKKIKGLQPKRADIIIAGTVILKIIMETIQIDSITVSESDNLEGMLYKYIGNN